MAAPAPKKGAGLALIFGAKPHDEPDADESGGPSDSDADNEGSDYGPDFEQFAKDALGTDDKDRIDSLWQAMKACCDEMGK